jgi:two-component system cell cycle sensor histidine kinase/response regulator CckA
MSDHSQSLAGIRVILSEDHDDTRDVLEQVFRHLGATVTAVALAREALGMVAAADIIVTDLAMPGADGVWLLEQVNRQPRRIPVIVVSGFTESQVPRLAEAPFARKLLKPVDPWDLAAVVVEVLRGRPL